MKFYLKDLMGYKKRRSKEIQDIFNSLFQHEMEKLKKTVETNPPELDATYEEALKPSVYEELNKVRQSMPSLMENVTREKDLYYLVFENLFYDHTTVINNQKIYLPYIQYLAGVSESKWLDAGCGRGEFLQLLSDKNIKAKGVEINKIECEMLQQQGYQVYNKHINEFLRETDQTFEGISALQVVEHFEINYLKDFLKLAFEKIKKNGLIIIETINPKSEFTLANFYLDETHNKPIPPKLLAYMMEWYGFKNLKILYSLPLPVKFRKGSKTSDYYNYAIIGEKHVL